MEGIKPPLCVKIDFVCEKSIILVLLLLKLLLASSIRGDVFPLVWILLDVPAADAYDRLLRVADVFVFAVFILAKLAVEHVFGFLGDVVQFALFFGDFTSDELIFAEDGFHLFTRSAGFRHRD